MRTLEFLYFYLMPEAATATTSTSSVSNTAVLPRSPSKLDSAFAGYSKTHSGNAGSEMDIDDDTGTKSMAEKQEMLGQYLNNVAELVQDLQESAPFGVATGGAW